MPSFLFVSVSPPCPFLPMRTLFYFSSSFISELFGSKGSPSPPTGTLGSILAPPSKVLGRESQRPTEE
ncbi:hypothetical protein V6N12_050014 [Hibiscus sabdariffa]|uniref:Uncharacterized protein n=1 Tax=Hibiscus sabdariffa TaxID=183260 RepID=A0ABR2GB71_9ROSI